MRKLEDFLLYCKEQNQFGLPNVIYASVCQRPVLYALLLHIIKRKMVFSFEEKKILIGFCTLLLWFRKNDSIDIAAYNFFMDCEFNLNAVKNCLFMLTMNNFLEIPPILKEDNQESISKRICDISELEHFLRIPYNIDRIWGWTKNEAREILLYATRDYIEDSFGGYSPWNGCWDEENRPWDYDHIFPQSWLKGSYQGANHDFSARIINSIGNIAPLPFSSNRSKNDDPPGDYMKEEINRKLLGIIDLIRARVNLVRVIQTYSPSLKLFGRSGFAPCPFCPENKHYLNIAPLSQTFECPVCDKKGDVFKFIMEMENLDFDAAADFLAQQVGIIIIRRPPDHEDEG